MIMIMIKASSEERRSISLLVMLLFVLLRVLFRLSVFFFLSRVLFFVLLFVLCCVCVVFVLENMIHNNNGTNTNTNTNTNTKLTSSPMTHFVMQYKNSGNSMSPSPLKSNSLNRASKISWETPPSDEASNKAAFNSWGSTEPPLSRSIFLKKFSTTLKPFCVSSKLAPRCSLGTSFDFDFDLI